MKPLYALLFFVFFGFAQKNTAQTTAVKSGVYITKDDFKNNRVIDEADCQNDKVKFKQHNFFTKGEFSVLVNGKKVTYLKKDIYAYRDCENTVWRFYQNTEYEIMEPKAIYIYAIRKIILTGEDFEREPVYYFSDGPVGDIKKLNIANLKTSFTNNRVFCNLLDTEVKYNRAIDVYNVAHKMYEVNYLYSESTR
jgi:hypothetical protein